MSPASLSYRTKQSARRRWRRKESTHGTVRSEAGGDHWRHERNRARDCEDAETHSGARYPQLLGKRQISPYPEYRIWGYLTLT